MHMAPESEFKSFVFYGSGIDPRRRYDRRHIAWQRCLHQQIVSLFQIAVNDEFQTVVEHRQIKAYVIGLCLFPFQFVI